MNNMICVIAATFIVLSASAWAGEEPPAPGKPYIAASRSEDFSAVVDAINHETRDVTLSSSSGETLNFIASPDVRNLDQVNVGDHVYAQYYEEVTIAVQEAKGAQPGAGQIQQIARAPKGAMPEGAVVGTTVINAIVEDINLQNNTFKLRGPDGNVEEFTARNPENLRRAAVGDLVVITITQALGIMVRAPDEK